ncbi:hypothetical protein HZS55_03600 [Halosimplex rubrum]|uniref:Uncharacterized protein n=1 Tax=Halosimplex rubrum TaxID=869889 RepID=A0A7D5P153_9EURY|nr:hypothetical protein [Halosimplex rubrum]QLH76441.1 hypothetical protein HZS55_03600 [Halosimplex rubrum]
MSDSRERAILASTRDGERIVRLDGALDPETVALGGACGAVLREAFHLVKWDGVGNVADETVPRSDLIAGVRGEAYGPAEVDSEAQATALVDCFVDAGVWTDEGFRVGLFESLEPSDDPGADELTKWIALAEVAIERHESAIAELEEIEGTVRADPSSELARHVDGEALQLRSENLDRTREILETKRRQAEHIYKYREETDAEKATEIATDLRTIVTSDAETEDDRTADDPGENEPESTIEVAERMLDDTEDIDVEDMCATSDDDSTDDDGLGDLEYNN